MKHMAFYTYTLLLLLIVSGWGAEQSTGNHARKQKINFQGTLTKYTGQTKVAEVSNISIAGVIENISLFQVPEQSAGKLEKDPKKGTISTIDLKEISRIDVPNPEKTWNFKRNESSDGTDYIEIFITPRGGDQKKNYMIERNRKLHYDEETSGGPISTQTPFYEIQSLVIKGCNERCNLNESEPAQNVCQPCPRPQSKNER